MLLIISRKKAYDRRGRTATVVRNSITKTFAYNDASQLLSETNSGGTLSSWWTTNTYDSLMRRTAFEANTSSVVKASFTYGYDNASRLQTVTDGTNNATYSYVANSPLVGQITFASNAVTFSSPYRPRPRRRPRSAVLIPTTMPTSASVSARPVAPSGFTSMTHSARLSAGKSTGPIGRRSPASNSSMPSTTSATAFQPRPVATKRGHPLAIQPACAVPKA
jgi:YD repeat-containing protein